MASYGLKDGGRHLGTERIETTGTMADLTRAFAWELTPLGPIEAWPDTLVSSVDLMLSTPQPTTLCWGGDLVFLYNDAAIPTLDQRHPSALGKSYREVFPEAWSLVEKDFKACYERGQTPIQENVLIPVWMNGVIEEQYWTYSLIPIRDKGRIAGVFNPHQNTTGSVLAARDRDKANVRLEQFLSATRDSVVGVDREWTIIYLNASAQKAYGLGRQLIGRNIWKEFPEAAYAGSPFFDSYNRAMHQGIPGSVEAYYPPPLDMWLQVEVYPTDEGIVTFSRDVTEQKRTADLLLRNEKLAAVGRLASSIAHEINNPLESVTNLIYLSKMNTEPGEVYKYLETAERELQRVSAISSQTLRFHKQSTKPSLVSCSDLFGEALSIYQGRLVNLGIKVEKRKRAERPAECFEGEIRQVLSNFISNAIDAMQPLGGRLVLRSRESTNWKTGQKGLVLTVADTGMGVSPEQQKKIFDAFYTTKGIGGTGLGLWVSKEIIERHHGAIRFRSSQRPEHQGTVFSVFLPFAAVSRQ